MTEHQYIVAIALLIIVNCACVIACVISFVACIDANEKVDKLSAQLQGWNEIDIATRRTRLKDTTFIKFKPFKDVRNRNDTA